MLVGFGNKARQGKNWLASEVHNILQREAQTFHFADSLKEIARVLGMRGKNSNFLQLLGEAMRTLDESYWITRVAAKIEEAAPGVALIPDVRFRNEAEWIRHRGGLVYRVRRLWDGEVYRASDRNPNHVSETDLDNYERWTRTFDIADGDIKHMQDCARKVVEDINSKRALLLKEKTDAMAE